VILRKGGPFLLICDSQDLTFHTVLSDWVATVRQDPWQRVLSVIAFYEKVIKVKADVAAFLN